MKITILRFYMPLAAKMKHPKTFWQKLFGAPQGHFIVKHAKEANIKQAIVQRVDAGYMKGQRLVFDQVEAVPPSLPLCVELIDEETKLREFLSQIQEELTDCRVVLFQGAELLAVETKKGK